MCLFMLLGGTAFAAVAITGKDVRNESLTGRDIKNGSIKGRDIANSNVTTKDIRKGTINTSDVGFSSLNGGDIADGSLSAKDFGLGELPSGPAGAKGDAGPNGAPGPAGTNGKDGTDGAPGPFPATLPSGKTLTGTYGGIDKDNGTDRRPQTAAEISFPFPLATPPTVRLVASGTTTPECQGTYSDPTAAAGNVCIYRSVDSTLPLVRAPDLAADQSGKTGLLLIVNGATFDDGTRSSQAFAFGTWAVTAP